MTELPCYRHILLATDGSSSAEPATRHALALAQQTGAALTTLYVVDTSLAFRLGIYQDEALGELREEGREALGSIADQAGKLAIQHHEVLGEGRPGEVILREAERLPADLVVLGSHGQGALTDLLLGSVSQYVIRHADVPVCVVRPPRR